MPNLYPKFLDHAYLIKLIIILFLFFTIGSSVAANIKLPMLGDSSSGIVSNNQEYKLGKAWLQSFRRHVEQHNDPLFQQYLEQLTFDLVIHSELIDRRLTLVLINNPSINAFAVPGGIIGVHTGIFTHAENEDQLASIISHELAHLSQRHYARGVEANKSSSAIALAGLLATIIVSAKAGTDAGMATLSATQAITTDQQLRYSRNNEKEADREGLKIMEKSGRNPRASAEMLEKMMAITRYKGNRLPDFLLTHPMTERRVSDTKSRTIKYQNRNYPDNFDYYIMQARAQVLQHDNPSYSIKFFQQKLSIGDGHKDAYRYGLAISHASAGDFTQAKQIMADLLDNKQNYAPFIYTAIELDILVGDYKDALEKLDAQLRLNPTNYPLRMLHAEALLKTHQYQQSAKVLTALSRQRPEDPNIWYQLAEVSGLAGDIAGVHTARAEYFILVGALENAQRQLKFAIKLLQQDVKQLAIIKHRLMEIIDMEKDLKKL